MGMRKGTVRKEDVLLFAQVCILLFLFESSYLVLPVTCTYFMGFD